MSLGANGKMILTATRELSRKWEQTKESWRDAKSEEFEQQFLSDLFSGVERCAPILEELEKALSKARSACE